jgi:hypothetical protein
MFAPVEAPRQIVARLYSSGQRHNPHSVADARLQRVALHWNQFDKLVRELLESMPNLCPGARRLTPTR